MEPHVSAGLHQALSTIVNDAKSHGVVFRSTIDNDTMLWALQDYVEFFTNLKNKAANKAMWEALDKAGAVEDRSLPQQTGSSKAENLDSTNQTVGITNPPNINV